jgi:hypothetical protein
MMLVVLVAVGCIGTPQPDPPNVVPEVDPEHIFGTPTDGPTVLIEGDEGAVTPEGATLRIYSLQREDLPVDVTPDASGAFSVWVPGEPGEEFRLEARLEDLRSAPVDVVVLEDIEGPVVPAARPLADCLLTSPESYLEVPEDGRATVEVINGCGGPVTLSRIAVRVAASPFAVVSPAAPIDVPDGGRQPIVVEYAPGPGDRPEEVLLIDISAPAVDHRPITLVGLSP